MAEAGGERGGFGRGRGDRGRGRGDRGRGRGRGDKGKTRPIYKLLSFICLNIIDLTTFRLIRQYTLSIIW